MTWAVSALETESMDFFHCCSSIMIPHLITILMKHSKIGDCDDSEAQLLDSAPQANNRC